jgi:hypothetical protein
MIGIAQGDRSGSKPLCSPGVKFWLHRNGGRGATRTADAGLSEGRGRYHFAALKGTSAAGTSSIKHGVVARDGIEPPTPAFSGPRSTTELPGLSADWSCKFLRGVPGWAGEGGCIHEQYAATT